MSRNPGKPASARRGLGRKIALFLLLGGLLFMAEQAWRDPEPTYFIHVGPQEIATLEQGWEKRGGRAPEPDVMESLIRSHIDDELLVAGSFGRLMLVRHDLVDQRQRRAHSLSRALHNDLARRQRRLELSNVDLRP